MINDLEIKNLIKEYQELVRSNQQDRSKESAQEQIYSKLVYAISDDVYNYPRFKLYLNEEHYGDFYLYFLERFPKALMKYKSQNSLFSSWFNKVLHHQLSNWRKKTKVESFHNTLYLSDFTYLEKEYLASSKVIRAKNQDIIDEKDQQIKKDLIQHIFNELPIKLSLLLKLHYFDFFNDEDLYEISTIFKIEHQKLIQEYYNFLQSKEFTQQLQKRQKLIDSTNSISSSIKEIKQQQFNLQHQQHQSYFDDSEWYIQNKQLIEKLSILEQQYRQNLSKLKRFHIKIKTHQLARLLDEPVNKIYNLLYRGKILLKQKVKDKFKHYF